MSQRLTRNCGILWRFHFSFLLKFFLVNYIENIPFPIKHKYGNNKKWILIVKISKLLKQIVINLSFILPNSQIPQHNHL